MFLDMDLLGFILFWAMILGLQYLLLSTGKGFLLLSLFWNPYNRGVSMLNIIPEIRFTHLHFFFFLLLSLFAL